MYHPYIRQKMFEARARELERIAADDRATRLDPRAGRRFEWKRLITGRRRARVPRSVRVDAGRPPAER